MIERHHFIDNLKAIAIVLVVLGHAPGMPAAAHALIFGVHVPAFFFAAGFLMGARPARGNARTVAEGQLRRFLAPYAAFFLLSYLYWLPARTLGNSAASYADLPWWDPFVAFAAGYGSYVNPTLWFFPCILATALLHLFARRHLPGPVLVPGSLVAAALVALLWQTPGPLLPWRLDTAIVALAFLSLGHWCGEHRLFGLARQRRPRLAWWAAVLGGLYATLALANPGVDLANMRFGVHPALYLPTAMLGIAACVLASLSFASSPLTRWLSANTLYIFPLHWLLFRIFTGAGIVLFSLPRDFKDQSWLIGIAYGLLALLLCWPIARLARRVTRNGEAGTAAAGG